MSDTHSLAVEDVLPGEPSRELCLSFFCLHFYTLLTDHSTDAKIDCYDGKPMPIFSSKIAFNKPMTANQGLFKECGNWLGGVI